MYGIYVTNYCESNALLERITKKDIVMSSFLSKCNSRLGDTVNLFSFLIMPIQRVLKYSLLLKVSVCDPPILIYNIRDQIFIAIVNISKYVNICKGLL